MTIPRLKRIAYGAAELGVSGSEVMIRVSLLIFYTQTVGLEPYLASYAIAIGVIWDAITDPLMGHISDAISINGEKRRPFFLPAAIGLAVSLICLFNVPSLDSQIKKFIYLFVTYICTNTFLTILSVPHTAFAGDISREKNIRMELFGWRMLFSNFGLLLGTAIPAIVTSYLGYFSSADAGASWIMAAITILGVLTTLLSTSGLDQVKKSQTQQHSFKTYRQNLSQILSNKSFLWLLIAYMVATIGLTLNSSLALYYYTFYLRLDDVTIRAIIAFFMLIFCLGIPLWLWSTKFFPKRKILTYNVFSLGIMTVFSYPLFPPLSIYGPLAAGLFGGIFVAAVVLLDVAVADLADQEAQKIDSHEPRLGAYFGFWKMGGKFSRAFALILTGHALTSIGFVAGKLPDPEVSFSIALLFGPGVGGFLLLAALILYFKFEKIKE